MGIQNKVTHEKFSPLGPQLNYLGVNWFNKDLEVSGETNQESKIDRLIDYSGLCAFCLLLQTTKKKKKRWAHARKK